MWWKSFVKLRHLKKKVLVKLVTRSARDLALMKKREKRMCFVMSYMRRHNSMVNLLAGNLLRLSFYPAPSSFHPFYLTHLQHCSWRIFIIKSSIDYFMKLQLITECLAKINPYKLVSWNYWIDYCVIVYRYLWFFRESTDLWSNTCFFKIKYLHNFYMDLFVSHIQGPLSM